MNNIDAFAARHLAKTAWAFSVAEGIEAPELFAAIAEAARNKVDAFEPRDFANVAHSFAKAGVAAPELFETMAAALTLEGKLATFTPRDVSNTCWAYATAGYAEPELFDAMAAAAAPRVGEFSPQGLVYDRCVSSGRRRRVSSGASASPVYVHTG